MIGRVVAMIGDLVVAAVYATSYGRGEGNESATGEVAKIETKANRNTLQVIILMGPDGCSDCPWMCAGYGWTEK